MSNDSKEWVTIKVPKEVRDDARDDPRTYGNIMQAGLDTRDEYTGTFGDELKPVPAEPSIPDDLRDQLDRIESAVSTPEDEGLYRGSMSDVLADLQDQLDDVKSAAGTAEERTGQIQGTLEDMGARR